MSGLLEVHGMDAGTGAGPETIVGKGEAGFGVVLDIATIGANNYSENLKFMN
ncbi:hypothetical protein [Burkholderia plantarii]|uniref:hypothetical protein n=1 Tax=Burkholderia plantarii TaxID=41899 RepID=UPI00131454D8|nr:hypothetical protein [Burkholderia plantarii]